MPDKNARPQHDIPERQVETALVDEEEVGNRGRDQSLQWGRDDSLEDTHRGEGRERLLRSATTQGRDKGGLATYICEITPDVGD